MNCEYTPSGNKVVKPTQYPLVEHRGDCIVISSDVPSCVSISSKVPECISISSIKDEVCCEIPDIPTLSPDDPPVNDLYEANTEYIFTITNFDENAFYYLYTPAESGTTTIVNDKITWITPDYNENTDFKCFYVTVKNTCGNTSSLQYCQHIIPQKAICSFTFKTTEVNEVVSIGTISDVNDNWVMDWGDGTKDHSTSHTYVDIGTYVCKLDIGQEAVLELNNNTQLLEFSDFGLVEWKYVNFVNSSNCNFTFQTNPNFSKMTSMSFMFYGCDFTNSTCNLNIGDWYIDNVVDFTSILSGCINTPTVDMSSFSGVICDAAFSFTNIEIKLPSTLTLSIYRYSSNFSNMFENSSLIGLETLNMLDTDDTGDAYYDVRYLFHNATLDGNLQINTSIDFTYNVSLMFSECSSDYSVTFNNEIRVVYYFKLAYNANISTLNIEHIIIETTDTNSMFKLSNIDTLNISNMNIQVSSSCDEMFSGAIITNLDLSTLNTINVTSMAYMFNDSNITNLDISQFNTTNVTNMENMFSGCSNFTSDLSEWDVSNVTNMQYIFNGCSNFTSDLSGWDVTNVTNMFGMFMLNTNFTSDLSEWDVSNVTTMWITFYGCSNFTSDLSGWDVSSVTNMEATFYDCTSLTSDLSEWDVSNVTTHDNFAYNCDISYTDDDGNQPYMPPFPT